VGSPACRSTVGLRLVRCTVSSRDADSACTLARYTRTWVSLSTRIGPPSGGRRVGRSNDLACPTHPGLVNQPRASVRSGSTLHVDTRPYYASYSCGNRVSAYCMVRGTLWRVHGTTYARTQYLGSRTSTLPLAGSRSRHMAQTLSLVRSTFLLSPRKELQKGLRSGYSRLVLVLVLVLG